MAKYVPAREDGLKPYVAVLSDWGRVYERTIWAKDAADARSKANPRRMGAHLKSVHRKQVDTEEKDA